MPIASLIDRGIVQGAYIPCSNLTAELRTQLENGRAIEAKRSRPIQDLHGLVVLSQNCDIHNSEEHFIEFALAKQIPESRANQRVQRARNLRKLHMLQNEQWWELESDLISVVPKKSLELIKYSDVGGIVDAMALDLLIQW